MSSAQLAEKFRGRRPLIHIVLDGWGLGPPGDYNAIAQANTPVMDYLLKNFPHTKLMAHGIHVGLPGEKDLGGSEVGHMTMGAGMILEQGPTYIKQLIDSGEFQKSPVLQKLFRHCLQHQSPLHLIGLLSDGNIHSHIDHFIAVIHHAFAVGIERLYAHALLDGRDTPIQSALQYIKKLEEVFHTLKQQRPGIDYAFASGGGRETITMDRDANWKKIEAGWHVHVRGESANRFESIEQAIQHFRNKQPDIMDQDLPAFVLVRNNRSIGVIKDQHSVIFMNFRADRALQFTHAMLDEEFSHFDRNPCPQVLYAGMTVYDQEIQFPENFIVGPTLVENPFGKRILESGLQQFRLTETQKFPHVTFFYNGGYRNPLDPQAEIYQLIASDKIASFSLAPAMKAAEIQQQAVAFINARRFDYGLVNFANADMVGHTANREATIAAIETIDWALGEIVKAIKQTAGLLVITADHGNADQMRSFNKEKKIWEADAKHSLNPVPFIIYDPFYNHDYRLKSLTESEELNLSQIAATNFILLGRTAPSDINDSLFQF